MRRQSQTVLSVLSFLSFAAVSVACGGSDNADPAPSGPEVPLPSDSKKGADDSSSKAPDAPPPPAPLPGTPTEDQVNEQFAIFVSATTGKPDGDGSRAKPLQTITQGIDLGKKNSKHVYLCEGTYSEAVTLERGISVIGGFDCGSPVWKKTTKQSRVNSPSSPAIKATNIDISTRIESLEVHAPDGTAAAPSSIGLHAKTSPALTVATSRIVAGRGFAGSDGVEGVQLTLGAGANGQAGQPQRSMAPDDWGYQLGGAGGVGSCIGAPGHDGENGGEGGHGGSYKCEGGFSTVWTVEFFGVLVPYPAAPGIYRTGAPGAAGASGLSASKGSLSADGFTLGSGSAGSNGAPGSGAPGKHGQVGQSLACGGSWLSSSASGGGAGGCPGLAGTAGTGGGASIGALVSSSIGLTLDATEISADDGGRGGNGTIGGAATVGGGSASSQTQSDAGGSGGASGVSGSGAGGPSYGIAQTGGEVKLVNNASAKHGRGGAGVGARSAVQLGVAKTLAASAAGDAMDVFTF